MMDEVSRRGLTRKKHEETLGDNGNVYLDCDSYATIYICQKSLNIRLKICDLYLNYSSKKMD